MRSLYPPIDPYQAGLLEVDGGHTLYFERSGTPGTIPAVFLHGGPGGGFSPEHRRLFDPRRYDLLLFDQRGCGRSRPHGEIAANTLWHLVADIERLRNMVGVDRWLVFGGSWGSTLALAYAETHPEQVSGMVLRGVYLLSAAEIGWYYRYGASEIFPDEWEHFLAPIPVPERHDLIAAYGRRLFGEDEAARMTAAKAWSAWEGATSTLVPSPELRASHADDDFALALARIENHYFANLAWLEKDQLLRDAGRLAGIAGTIIHGRYDMPCPTRSAWSLHQAWPTAALQLVEAAGHEYSEPPILDRLIAATDAFAARLGAA